MKLLKNFYLVMWSILYKYLKSCNECSKKGDCVISADEINVKFLFSLWSVI